MKNCCAIGSVNMNMVTRTDKFPKPGETRRGISFQTIPGGKGANQVVALSCLGIPTSMAGRIGANVYGQMYIEHFEKTGTQTKTLGMDTSTGTGVAAIEVDDAGENHIIVVPGANDTCTPAWLEEIFPLIGVADVFLLQLEIPLETVQAAADRLYALGKTIYSGPRSCQALKPGIALQYKHSHPQCYRHLLTTMANACKTAGVEHRGLHALRHSFASNLYARGVMVKVISKLLGHASVEITYNRCIHFFEGNIDDTLRQAVGA